MPIVTNWLAIGIGLISMFLGYRLFCGKRSVLLTNLVAGALLALIGMGLTVAGIRGASRPHPVKSPDWQRPVQIENFSKAVDRFV